MQGFKYVVDIAMCIDSTGSMKDLLDVVKTNAMRFQSDVESALKSKGKQVDALRVKVIAFRDFFVDSARAIEESPFFVLPEEGTQFSSFVSALKATGGGGNGGESGLEALTLAIRSKWSNDGDRRRHIVVLWTDDAAHKLEKGARERPQAYPRDMPANLEALTDLWEGQGNMSRSAKRLILFAPDAYPWSDLAKDWELCLQYKSQAGTGIDGHDYSSIVDVIANSV
ncbi:MAG: VWA domain-containing protein [Armatimonadetes bacterium]|nr:VWA domain-containing protein [Armatimonadota bacterium]